GEIASTSDNPESVKLGHCKLIEEIMIGEDKLIHFSGVEMGQACTIVLRGASFHVHDEAERSLHDALCCSNEGAAKDKMREKMQKIIGHGINCFVNRQLIYNFPEELFPNAEIFAIEHARGVVTGGEIASTSDNPESVKLGHCKLIEEIMIGEDKFFLDKKIGLGQPKRIENANIFVANTAMDTDKVKIYEAQVRVDSMAKVAQMKELQRIK
nr:T-complex protein 1 subunit beta [Tanacetum cinerariifolium]